VYQSSDGWYESLDNVRSYQDLPAKAKDYIQHLEQLLKTRISMVSTGPEREKLFGK
jgi:adenylosuccinate synthase